MCRFQVNGQIALNENKFAFAWLFDLEFCEYFYVYRFFFRMYSESDSFENFASALLVALHSIWPKKLYSCIIKQILLRI